MLWQDNLKQGNALTSIKHEIISILTTNVIFYSDKINHRWFMHRSCKVMWPIIYLYCICKWWKLCWVLVGHLNIMMTSFFNCYGIAMRHIHCAIWLWSILSISIESNKMYDFTIVNYKQYTTLHFVFHHSKCT